MKTPAFLSCLLALLLSSCNVVTVKQPAGDGAVELKPELWTAKWRGADGVQCITRILDRKKGIVQVRAMSPGEKEEIHELVIRELSGRMVATLMDRDAKAAGEYAFVRIAVSEDHLAWFMPNEITIREAVGKGSIPGIVRKGEKKENQTGGARTLLERFGAAEAEKSGGVLACFEPDPTLVLIRDDKPASPDPKPRK